MYLKYSPMDKKDYRPVAQEYKKRTKLDDDKRFAVAPFGVISWWVEIMEFFL